MVNHFVRNSFVGLILNRISGHKILPFAEELDDYVIPEKYLNESKGTVTTADGDFDKEAVEVERGSQDESETSSQATAQKDDNDGKIVVDWEGPDDPENPYNWPFYQKILVAFEVAFLTVSVYIGAAIYTPGVTQIMEKFDVGTTQATVPLTMFVIGYGIGPMFLSPITENAAIGRTPVYIISLFIFFILQIPTALVNNLAGLCVLRLIAGFFASPALSTGGATIGDVISFPYMPVGLGIWSIGGVCGPSLGPLIGSGLVLGGENVSPGNGWRWPFWFMAMISGFCLIVLSVFMPETYGKALLYRKALRLRAKTGNQDITSEGEIENSKMTMNEIIVDTLWRPLQITLVEPVVLLINLHITLLYTIMYLWFEAFPIVFIEVHHFTLVENGVSFLAIAVGIMLGAAIYIPFIYKKFTVKILAGEPFVPEVFLPSAVVGSFLIPVGIFIFGWTSSADIHWIAPMIGGLVFASGAFVVFQTEFNYLGASFWRFLASVFASNALFRSVIAGCFPLFANALFRNTGSEKYPVGWGSSILGFISLLMCLIPILFNIYGPQLRARSKYAN